METNHSMLSSHDQNLNFKASQKQIEYFNESIYDILTPGGQNYRRNLELIAFNALTGNMLIREKISYRDTNYEKVYILSKEGKAEKFRAV